MAKYLTSLVVLQIKIKTIPFFHMSYCQIFAMQHVEEAIGK